MIIIINQQLPIAIIHAILLITAVLVSSIRSWIWDLITLTESSRREDSEIITFMTPKEPKNAVENSLFNDFIIFFNQKVALERLIKLHFPIAHDETIFIVRKHPQIWLIIASLLLNRFYYIY